MTAILCTSVSYTFLNIVLTLEYLFDFHLDLLLNIQKTLSGGEIQIEFSLAYTRIGACYSLLETHQELTIYTGHCPRSLVCIWIHP